VAEGLRQQVHVGMGCLAHLSHRIDKRDLGGEECVRRHLDQLGRNQIGDQERHADRDLLGVHLAQQSLGPL
jgi:hypothetical protein